MITSRKDEDREHTHRRVHSMGIEKEFRKKGTKGERERGNVHLIRVENRYKTKRIARVECE